MKVVTFGELMIRLQPFNYERFVQANTLEFSFGGGEANVAVSLANYGADAVFVTKLPSHAIGQSAVNSLRRYGVDTSKIKVISMTDIFAKIIERVYDNEPISEVFIH